MDQIAHTTPAVQQVDNTPQVQTKKVAGSLAQLENQFRALEVDRELYLMKKELGLV